MPPGSRNANINVRLRNKKLRADRRRVERELRATGKGAGKALGNSFRTALGGIATLGSVGGLATLGKEALDFERGFTRLGIQAGDAFDGKAFRASIGQISGAMGQGKTDVLGMATAIVNLEGAAGLSTEKLEVLTRASVATGAAMDDMAGFGFALRNAFDIKEAEQLESTMSRIVNIGKKGSVPLAEMNMVFQQQATSIAKISAAGAEGAAQLAALVQVGRKGAGSAGEVGTQIKALVNGLAKADPKLEKLGAQISTIGKDGKREFKDIFTILDEIGKTGILEDETKLQRVFGSSEARKLLMTVKNNRKEFEGLIDSSRGALDVQQDSAKFLESSAGRFDKALIRIKASLAAAFTPERIETVVEVVDVLADVVGFAVDNVWGLVAGWAAFKALKISSNISKLTEITLELAKTGTPLAGVAKQTGAVTKGTNKMAKALDAVSLPDVVPAEKGFRSLATGILSSAAALTAAAAAGFSLGRALDDLSGGRISGAVFGATEALVGKAGEETPFQALKRLQAEALQTRKAEQRKRAADVKSGLSPEEIAQRDARSRALSIDARARKAREREEFNQQFADPSAGISFGGDVTIPQGAQLPPSVGVQPSEIKQAIKEGMAEATIELDGAPVNKQLANDPSRRRTTAP